MWKVTKCLVFRQQQKLNWSKIKFVANQEKCETAVAIVLKKVAMVSFYVLFYLFYFSSKKQQSVWRKSWIFYKLFFCIQILMAKVVECWPHYSIVNLFDQALIRNNIIILSVWFSKWHLLQMFPIVAILVQQNITFWTNF